MSVARQLALGLVTLTLISAFEARAQSDEDRARELFRTGVALAKEERWSDALEKFEESRALYERPSTVFNIGTTLVRLQRHKAAITAFEQFIALTDRDDQRKAAEDLIAQSRASLASIELSIEPREATLTIDGEPIPPNGPVRHLELDPGERVLEITAEGFGSVRETISLEPGVKLIRAIALEPSPSPPPPAVAVAPSPPRALSPVVKTDPTEKEVSFFESPWFWAIAGAVVLATAIGIGVAVSADNVEDPVGGTTMQVIVP